MEDTDNNDLLTNIDSEMDRNYRVNVIIESLDSSDEETEVEHPPSAKTRRSSITNGGPTKLDNIERRRRRSDQRHRNIYRNGRDEAARRVDRRNESDRSNRRRDDRNEYDEDDRGEQRFEEERREVKIKMLERENFKIFGKKGKERVDFDEWVRDAKNWCEIRGIRGQEAKDFVKKHLIGNPLEEVRKIEETTEGRKLTTEALMRKVGERCYGQKTRHDLKREMVAVKWNGIEEAASYLRRKEEAIKRFNPQMPQVEMAEEFVFGAKDLACHTFLERELKREERDDPNHILEKIKGRIMDEGTRRKEDGTKLDDYKMPERKNDVNRIEVDLRKNKPKEVTFTKYVDRRSPRRSPGRTPPRKEQWKRPMEEIRRKEEDTRRYGRLQERRQERNDPSVQVRCNNCQGIGHYFWQCASGFQDRRNVKSYGVNNANKYSSRYFLKENEERKEEDVFKKEEVLKKKNDVFKEKNGEVLMKKGRRFSEEGKNEKERKNVSFELTKNDSIQNSSLVGKEKEKENKIGSVSELISNIFNQQKRREVWG